MRTDIACLIHFINVHVGDFNFYLNPKLDKFDNMSNRNDNPLYRNRVNVSKRLF